MAPDPAETRLSLLYNRQNGSFEYKRNKIVTGMIERVRSSDDRKIVIQSTKLTCFFRDDVIEIEIERTDAGIVAVQFSDAPEIVKALLTHASEAPALAEQEMYAVHKMMMQLAGI